ncbi:MAG: hypothetical protein QXO84_01550 [Candidatus Aenigmatarchaeota archaeon]
MFPQIKKKIEGFLLSEDGQISKNVILSLGFAAGMLGSQIATAQHTSTSITYQPGQSAEDIGKVVGIHSLSTPTPPPPPPTEPPAEEPPATTPTGTTNITTPPGGTTSVTTPRYTDCTHTSSVPGSCTGNCDYPCEGKTVHQNNGICPNCGTHTSVCQPCGDICMV